jgi:hypothetical protein
MKVLFENEEHRLSLVHDFRKKSKGIIHYIISVRGGGMQHLKMSCQDEAAFSYSIA